MSVFELRVDYNAKGNSLWGMLLAEVKMEETWPLFRARPLAAEWRPMPVSLHDAKRYAEFLHFSAGGWAVRPEARSALEPILGEAAEFLPLACDTGDEFFALHPLQLAELGPDADAPRNDVSGNITHVRRYSFEPNSLTDKVCFRISHPPGSAAGTDGGGSRVLVSPLIRKFIEENEFRGVRCISVFPTDAVSSDA